MNMERKTTISLIYKAIERFTNICFPRLTIYLMKRRVLKLPLDIKYPFEPELKIVKNIIKPNCLFFDVGTNKGIYSYIVKDVINQEKIYCFEPITRLSKLLKRRLKEASVYNIALSDRIGQAELRIPFINGEKVYSRATIEDSVHEVGETAYERVEIYTTTLDQFVMEKGITSIGFIKIDVEGHEYEVLKGGITSIKTFKPIMLIEIEQRHHDFSIYDIFNFIKSLDYVIYYLNLIELRLCSLDEFSVQRDQHIDNSKTGKYIKNFICIPRKEEQKVLKTLNIENNLKILCSL